MDPQHQPHHQQPLPGMMMPPNSYSTHHHLSNNSNYVATNDSPNSMQQLFSYNVSDQYGGGGSSPSGGFRDSGYSIEAARKKRGRPKKYSPLPDGNITAIPNCGRNLESSNDGTLNTDSSTKKNRGRPPGSGRKQMDALGAAGVGFMPHVIIVRAGEDIASTLVSFSQQGPRTVCILSAIGAICNVTLHQPATSGGTVTYEGQFEIISLSGSYLHSESSNGSHSKASGLSVSLAGSDGRVLGGDVAGMLLAASPVQVIVGSFITATDGKKPKSSIDPSSSSLAVAVTAAPPPNMLNFSGGGGGAVPGISPPSEGASSESSDESGSSPSLHMFPGSYNNDSNNAATHHHHQQQQQQQPLQNLAMYSNMGWLNSTMNMLPN